MPDIGSLAPAIDLQTLGGRSFSLWALKNRKNAVIVFVDMESERDLELLDLLADRKDAFVEDNAEVVAVAGASPEEIADGLAGEELPFMVLADTEGHTTAAYGVLRAMVFVVDRYGQIALIADPRDAPVAALDKVLDKLALIELECPECGISAWPETT